MNKKSYKKALFIHRRDLRIDDNYGLIQANTLSEQVVPLFNFDPVQVDPDNEYRSPNAIQFMIESLQDLSQQYKKHDGRLFFLYGDPIKNIAKLIKDNAIDAVFINFDYTPFALKRDKALHGLCKKHAIAFHGYHDELLIGDPQSILTNSDTPYGVYTAFYTKASGKKVPTPHAIKSLNLVNSLKNYHVDKNIYKKVLKSDNPDLKVHGGRKNSLKILRSLDKYKNYTDERNFPALDNTTHLSASHKFGTISIRESYHAIKKALGARTQLLKELYWRDFFTYVAFHNPRVFGHAYREKYDNLEWSKSKKNFEAWCNGMTGFPIVDAGMRQLNTTGWMHNRVRMITASFLVKDLHINWKWGEKYFAQQLVDYDPSVNNGNWQWAASTGCDAQPYFRIFNPWTQQKKFDPECTYIKQWIPELEKVDIKTIHGWFKDTYQPLPNYPKPIINHDEARKITLAMYKRL